MSFFKVSLLSTFLVIIYTTSVMGSSSFLSRPILPKDSLLNKITDIDSRLKLFTEKDTLGGFSTPRKIAMSDYFNQRMNRVDQLRDREGLIVVPYQYEPFLSYMNFVDTMIVDPIMLPIVFDGELLPQKLSFISPISDFDNSSSYALVRRDSIVSPKLYQYRQKQKDRYKLISEDVTLSSKVWEQDRRKGIRKQYYISHPERIKSNALAFSESPILKGEVENRNPFKQLITAGDAIEISRPEVESYKIKQVFWKFQGEHNLSVSQRSYSYSWGPKTNDNFNIQSYQSFKAEYKKDKITFNHLLEWRFNIQQVSLTKEEKERNPDHNSLLIGDDLLRSFNTLGLQSFLKNWAYTITLEATTPVFYKKPQDNKNNRIQGPFSPLNVNFGIGGVQYKLNKTSKIVKGRKIDLTANLAPLSFSLRHVGSRRVYENNNYGVVHENGPAKGEEGYRPKYTKTSFGSTLNANIQYNFNNYAFIRSRVKYDTDYESAKLENETTIEFKLNRFFSTSLYVYMKYDDSDFSKRDEKWKYFSANEVLGFGLSYSWN